MSDFKSYRGKGGLNLQIDFPGFAEAISKLNNVPADINLRVGLALLSWGKDVMERSKSLVPVRTGRLRESGQVNLDTNAQNVRTLHLGYGDRKTVWYAQIVHERLDVRHPSGSAKFLEVPINENLKSLDVALAASIESALEKVA